MIEEHTKAAKRIARNLHDVSQEIDSLARLVCKTENVWDVAYLVGEARKLERMAFLIEKRIS